MSDATRCTCLRDGEHVGTVLVVGDTCPALAAGIHVGGNAPPATTTPAGGTT